MADTHRTVSSRGFSNETEGPPTTPSGTGLDVTRKRIGDIVRTKATVAAADKRYAADFGCRSLFHHWTALPLGLVAVA
jgi:hypothetical protein